MIIVHVHAYSCPTVIAAHPRCRIGTYAGHCGRIIQLLSLGDVLLSLGDDQKLLVWAANTYDAPKVVASQCACIPPTITNHERVLLNDRKLVL